MKSKITALLAIVVLASCSTPRYSYYFSHHDYNAGRKQSKPIIETSPLSNDPQMLTASISEQPVVVAPSKPERGVVVSTSASGKTYLQLNKAERKAVRHYLKNEIKTFVSAKKKMDSAQATRAGMDHDLKLAIIFGAVGIVGLLIGGDVFWIIGGIALLIGVVFFVKWIIRQ